MIICNRQMSTPTKNKYVYQYINIHQIEYINLKCIIFKILSVNICISILSIVEYAIT